MDGDQKGFFPYQFHTENNFDYVGPLPDRKFFEPERMSLARRSEFEEWYSEAALEFGDNYNLQDECLKYCINDVEILRQCCIIHRQHHMEFCGLDPFDDTTNPSANMRAFQVCNR